MEEAAGTCLVEQKGYWTQASEKAAGPSEVTRKGAPGAGGKLTASTQGPVGVGGGGTAFQARMMERETPVGVWEYAWRGTMFPLGKLSVYPQPSSRNSATHRRAAAAAALAAASTSAAVAPAVPTAAAATTAAALSGNRSRAGS